MKKIQRNSRPARLAIEALCGMAMIFAAQTAFSQQPSPATDVPKIPASIAVAKNSPQLEAPPRFEEAAEDTARHGGIKVHGHWVIDVRNPDGTLAQHRAFENAVTTNGQQALAALLGGIGVAADWAIGLDPAGGTSSCGSSDCFIVQSKTGLVGGYICGVLASCAVGVTEKVNLAAVPYSLVLTGQYTAPAAGVIGTVSTIAGICTSAALTAPSPDTTVAPAACVTQSYNGSTNTLTPFTQTSITAVPIAAGQIVQVSVTLTFS